MKFLASPIGISKTDVGLGSVDNTADVNKPVSTAQAAADNLRLLKTSNLSDLASAATARTNLGLGGAALLAVGTTAGTVAAGDHVHDAAVITTGTLAIARGGNNSAAVPTAGAVAYGTGTAYAFTGVGTAKQVLQSNVAGPPTWVTPDLTYLPQAWVKKSVRAATTVNITLSGTQTVDGIALVAGDRALVKNQTLPQNNGIYDVSAGAWTRSADAATASMNAGATLNVDSGTQSGTKWTTTATPADTLDTTVMSWFQSLDSSIAVAHLSGSETITGDKTFTGQEVNQHSAGTVPVQIKARTTGNGGQSGHLLDFIDAGGATPSYVDATGVVASTFFKQVGGKVGVTLGKSNLTVFSGAAAASVVWDSYTNFNGTFTPSGANVTIPANGLYAFTIDVAAIGSTPSGRSFMTLWVNAVLHRTPLSLSDNNTLLTAVLPLAAGDTVFVDLYHTSGASRVFTISAQMWQIFAF